MNSHSTTKYETKPACRQEGVNKLYVQKPSEKKNVHSQFSIFNYPFAVLNCL